MSLEGEISVINRQKRLAINTRKIRKAAGKILGALGYEGYELSIVIVDDPEITRLNRQYFRRNRPTNVISFSAIDGETASFPNKVLGDVVISAQTAKREAKEAGMRGEKEILFLLVHGVLHLVGYEHEGSREERRNMEAKEQELFSRLMTSKGKKESGN